MWSRWHPAFNPAKRKSKLFLSGNFQAAGIKVACVSHTFTLNLFVEPFCPVERLEVKSAIDLPHPAPYDETAFWRFAVKSSVSPE
jgi:hypothetical protein